MHASPVFQLRPFLLHEAASDVVHSKDVKASPCACSGKPMRYLEVYEEAFADGPARVSQVQDRGALASLSFRSWAHQHGHIPKTAGFALGDSPNRSRTIAAPEPR